MWSSLHRGMYVGENKSAAATRPGDERQNQVEQTTQDAESQRMTSLTWSWNRS